MDFKEGDQAILLAPLGGAGDESFRAHFVPGMEELVGYEVTLGSYDSDIHAFLITSPIDGETWMWDEDYLAPANNVPTISMEDFGSLFV